MLFRSVLIPTPTGKTLVSFVSVPKLVTEHQDFILTAWTAFHNVKNAKDMSTVKSDLAIVKAVYDAYDTPFTEDVIPDFNVLKNYINDYIGKKKEILWFVNYPIHQSIPDLWHCHFFYKI